ncbi:MAG: Trm112 family protein [Rhizobiaceae bacterium]|nr:Trm112 family protein [Rhizobiaceae bacterium]
MKRSAKSKSQPKASQIDVRMLELLACPLTKGPLVWDAERRELVSRTAKLAYPVRDGIPVMLPSEARPIDKD